MKYMGAALCFVLFFAVPVYAETTVLVKTEVTLPEALAKDIVANSSLREFVVFAIAQELIKNIADHPCLVKAKEEGKNIQILIFSQVTDEKRGILLVEISTEDCIEIKF